MCSLLKRKKINDICYNVVKNTLFTRGSYWDRHRDHCNGILQWGREFGLNSEYCMDKWEFIAKKQVGSLWVENYWGNIRRKGDSGKTDQIEFLWRQARVARHHLKDNWQDNESGRLGRRFRRLTKVWLSKESLSAFSELCWYNGLNEGQPHSKCYT